MSRPRPLGISILAGAYLFGFASAFVIFLLTGAFPLTVGSLLVAVIGVGLWRMAPWAWAAALLGHVAGGLLGLVAIGVGIYGLTAGPEAGPWASLAGAASLTIGIPILVTSLVPFGYLLWVRRAFRAPLPDRAAGEGTALD